MAVVVGQALRLPRLPWPSAEGTGKQGPSVEHHPGGPVRSGILANEPGVSLSPPACGVSVTQEDTQISRLAPEPERAAPPRQLQVGPASAAEFVICDHTIEFTFRDAKQYWGLEDFMTVSTTGVSNAANLSLLMVSLSAVLLREARASDPQCSVLDLKASYRGSKYVSETLKLLPEKLDEGLILRIYHKVTSLGRIHPPGAPLKAA